MKKVIISILVLAFWQIGFSQTPFKDFFDSINWSDTEAQFIQRWPGQVTNVNHFYNEYGKFTTDYAITDVQLGEWNLQVDVNVNEDSKTLKFLSASIPADKEHMAIMEKAEQCLTALYGNPEIIEDELKAQFAKYKNVKWYSGNYSLELSINIYPSKTFIRIHAEEHDNNANDFRVAKWGDSMADVMAKEGKENLSTSPDVYMFHDIIAGMDCAVGYVFVNDKLTMAKYLLNHKHTNLNDYISDYNMLVGLLTKKYGEPYHNSPVWKNTLFKNDPSNYGLAISSGHLVYGAKWNLDKTTIDVILGGENYKIDFQIQYLSKQYKDAQSSKQEKATLDML